MDIASPAMCLAKVTHKLCQCSVAFCLKLKRLLARQGFVQPQPRKLTSVMLLLVAIPPRKYLEHYNFAAI